MIIPGGYPSKKYPLLGITTKQQQPFEKKAWPNALSSSAGFTFFEKSIKILLVP
jgi:hypothetical protein